MSMSTICLALSVLILIICAVYLDIINEKSEEIREIAECCGWADMDKVRDLDGKRYSPATAIDAEFFMMPDGTKIRRR